MSEELIVDPGLEVPGGAPAAPNVEVSSEGKKEPKEDQAKALGWKPLEAWVEDGHDPDDHVSAKEFVARESFFKKISSQNRELSSLRQRLDEQSQFQGILFEEARKKALSELKAQHRQAVEDGDPVKADQLVTEIEAQARQPVLQPRAPQGMDPAIQSWMDDNAWYQTDDIKRPFANDVGAAFINQYRVANGGRVPAPIDVLNHVSTKIKERFPTVRKTVQGPGSSPEGNTSRGANKGTGFKESDLTDTELNIMNDLVKKGEMTKEKYLASMASLKKGRS